jgi:hypothetical protein
MQTGIRCLEFHVGGGQSDDSNASYFPRIESFRFQDN